MTFSLRLKTDELISLPRPAVMGVVNVSPNSFFMPHSSLDSVLNAVDEMIAAGVDIIDVGGEATNPKVNIEAEAPSVSLELDRVVPAIEAIRKRYDGLISVDTSQASVMRDAVAAGADIINDQRALVGNGALPCAVTLKVPVILMHFFHEPRVPGSTTKEQLLAKVQQDLMTRVQTAQLAGIGDDRIILDPGFGQGNYGKNCDENFYLLARLPELLELGFPLLSGWSRKSMIGDVLGGVPSSERLFGTVAANSLATYLGAHILRVHDVQAAQDAARVAKKLRNYN